MKILLVADARGVHEYIYRGLTELGHTVHFAQFGDKTIGHIDNTYNFDPFRKVGYLGKIVRPFANLLNVNKLSSFDIASYVHRISFVDKPSFLRYRDIPTIRKKVSLMSYTALGCDELSFIWGNSVLPYKPCDTCQRYDDKDNLCAKRVRPRQPLALYYLNKYFDTCISSAVEYSQIEHLFDGGASRIPLPVDLSEVKWVPADGAKRRVNIVHTPSREGFKGTEVVLRAIEELRDLRDDFDFTLIHGLAFKEYIEAISESDIVIDQVWSQSPGMNALWLLAMGKIVFSGNSNLFKSYFSFGKESPIINAEPNPHLLAAALSAAIDNKSDFGGIAAAGRKYISRYHDHILVSKKYLSLWEQ